MAIRNWSTEENVQLLREAVAASTSMRTTLEYIGLSKNGHNKSVRKHIDRLNLDTAHWKTPGLRSFTDEEFIEAWYSSSSMADCARKLKLSPTSSTMRSVSRRLKLTNTHMTGRKGFLSVPKPLEDLLKEDTYTYSSHLKKRLINEGLLLARCSECKLTEWRDSPLVLELDHINGNNKDNRIENLRLLCPNCHSLTATWRGRNKKSRE